MDGIGKLFQAVGINPFPVGHPAYAAGRSPQWNKVRKEHLKRFPICCVSGLKKNLDVHHVLPYHLHPELELDPKNLRTISRPYHFLIGHLCNWSSYNPDFDAMVYMIRHAQSVRPMSMAINPDTWW